jgi:NAD(P)-dependent dehydrogenase (short-subunit alcohol dehydrogenase family)
VSHLGRVDGKVAIVTGGSHGIGEAICLLLAKEGATVIIFDIDRTGAAKVAGKITETGSRAEACQVDISDSAQVDAAVNKFLGMFGRVDILVNNAGII